MRILRAESQLNVYDVGRDWSAKEVTDPVRCSAVIDTARPRLVEAGVLKRPRTSGASAEPSGKP